METTMKENTSAAFNKVTVSSLARSKDGSTMALGIRAR